MVKRTKPAAGDGGSRQCIGSGQNHAAETKATPDTTQAVLPIDQIIVGDRTVGLLNPITSTRTDACWLALEGSPRASAGNGPCGGSDDKKTLLARYCRPKWGRI